MLFVHWFLWPLRLVWLLVCCLYKEVYLQIFKYVSFWLHGCCGESEGGPVNQVNHTSWMTVVTPTDRPKSVRNCCLIELFCSVVCVVTLPFWHFFCSRVFCHRTWSDLLLFCLKTAWWVSLLVDQRVPEGTCRHVLRPTSVDSWRFESINIFCVKFNCNCNYLGLLHYPSCL